MLFLVFDLLCPLHRLTERFERRRPWLARVFAPLHRVFYGVHARVLRDLRARADRA